MVRFMDLSLFEEKYSIDEKGVDAYLPKALLKIINNMLIIKEGENNCKKGM